MRDIKFRGKDILHKSWQYGSLAKDEPQKAYYIIDNKYGRGIDVDENTVGQYTGLKDKNGKEIYEGDIVLYEDWEMATENGSGDSFINKGIVGYCEENCRFYVTEKQTILDEDVFYKGNEDLEVIGNIYDNPDLLEKGAEE